LAEVAARDVGTRWRKFDFSSCHGQLGQLGRLAYTAMVGGQINTQTHMCICRAKELEMKDGDGDGDGGAVWRWSWDLEPET